MNPYDTLMRWGLGLLFVLLMLGGLAKCSYDAGNDAAVAKQAKADEKAAVITRAKEEALLGVVWNIAYDTEETRIAREAEFDRTIADLRAGTIVVRPRFQCPKLPRAAKAPTGSDDQAGAGLLPADVEFLLHEAGRADAITSQLGQCQAVVQAYWQATQP